MDTLTFDPFLADTERTIDRIESQGISASSTSGIFSAAQVTSAQDWDSSPDVDWSTGGLIVFMGNYSRQLDCYANLGWRDRSATQTANVFALSFVPTRSKWIRLRDSICMPLLFDRTSIWDSSSVLLQHLDPNADMQTLLEAILANPEAFEAIHRAIETVINDPFVTSATISCNEEDDEVPLVFWVRTQAEHSDRSNRLFELYQRINSVLAPAGDAVRVALL